MKQENIFYMAEQVEWKLGISEKVVSSEEKSVMSLVRFLRDSLQPYASFVRRLIHVN